MTTHCTKFVKLPHFYNQLQVNKYLVLILVLFAAQHIHAQQLTGIWSGKISRRATASLNASVESLEIQLTQFGNLLSGNSFAFSDNSRFVLYRVEGQRKRKQKTIRLQELGRPAYVLPDNFSPCEKVFDLKYYKIGKTQYLSGTWGGKGTFGDDTTCFPNEELLVVLQKIKNPDYPIESFVGQKLLSYYTKPRNNKRNTGIEEDSTWAEYVPIDQVKPLPEDSSLADRKLDIQQILKVRDSSIKVILYDNAIVDEDTVSIFVNKIPVLVKQRISDKAIPFFINATEPGKPIEILMQAENLGSIPPNTALMIVESGSKRYEVRLSSGFEKHAVIIITFDPE